MKFFNKSLYLYFTFIICVSPVSGQSVSDKIDKYMQSQYDIGKFYGSILAAKDGKIVYKNAFGYSDLAKTKKLKTDTKFIIGDIAFPLAAISILQLNEQGKVDLEESVRKYFPDSPAFWQTMKIKYLLNHTSGLVNHRRLTRNDYDLNDEKDIDNVIRGLYAPLLMDEPGKTHFRSPSNFLVLNKIISITSGIQFEEYIQKNIFDKLKMKNSGYVKNEEDISSFPNRFVSVSGDLLDNKKLTYSDVKNNFTFYSTVEDLLKLDKALYSTKLLKKETIDMMYSNGVYVGISTYNYAKGWYVFTLFDKNVYGHDSHSAGLATRIIRFPDDDIFVALLSTFSNSPNILIPRDIAALMLGKDVLVEHPHIRKKVDVSYEILKKYIGIYELQSVKIEIKFIEGELKFKFPNGNEQVYLSETKNKFFRKSSDVYYTFEKNTNDDYDLVRHWGGHELIYKKLSN